MSQQSINITWSGPGGSVGGTITKTNDTDLIQTIACNGSGTNSGHTDVSIAVGAGKLGLLYAKCTGPVNLVFTLGTGSVTIPVDVGGYIWVSDLFANPFGAYSIVSLQVQNAGADAQTLELRLSYDGTP
jgi:hypothetical protein